MKKIIIDVDEVVCISSFLDEINKFLGANYKLDDFHDYYLDDVLGSDENKKRFYDSLQNIDIYQNAVLLDNVVESIKELSNYYEIYFCSNCAMYCNKEDSGIFFKHKYDFLVRTFPFIDPEHFIFTGAKNVFKADVQIDDRLDNLNGDIDIKLLFDAYHNRDIDESILEQNNVKRVHDWREILDILLKRENDCIC